MKKEEVVGRSVAHPWMTIGCVASTVFFGLALLSLSPTLFDETAASFLNTFPERNNDLTSAKPPGGGIQQPKLKIDGDEVADDLPSAESPRSADKLFSPADKLSCSTDADCVLSCSFDIPQCCGV